jgi:DNA polymerase-3 subunit gamma/tau
MRDLLDNAQYAPSAGRFKVYIIDEVHMLSKSAFNAMLKTLEEPPAHVKFILATTDPQKVPVTVLSRCLQFNLRQMAGTSIIDHLQNILTQEAIPFQASALHLIARAADGSMRDALSLTDQAIAYGGHSVNEAEVRDMLGAIDQSYLYQLINALLAEDGAALIAQANAMEQRSLSFASALNDLAQLLHQIAVAQTVPDSVAHDLPERAVLLDFAQRIPAATLQLYYQIALLGRRDIGLAPDELAGFSMSLLRMLAFSPKDQALSNASLPALKLQTTGPATATASVAALASDSAAAATIAANEASKPQVPDEKSMQAALEESPQAPHEGTLPAPSIDKMPFEEAMPSEPIPMVEAANADAEYSHNEPMPSDAGLSRQFNGDWRNLVDNLKLGLARALSQHCELIGYDENSISLSVPELQKHLLLPNYQEKLSTAINQYFDKKIKLHFSVGGTGNTPAQQINQEKAQAQSTAETAIEQDGFVQALINDFGAQIIPNSIKPI